LAFWDSHADLEITILLPLPPECWDYRHAPPHLEFTCFYAKFSCLWNEAIISFCIDNASDLQITWIIVAWVVFHELWWLKAVEIS
jgi:hypothetical protein